MDLDEVGCRAGLPDVGDNARLMSVRCFRRRLEGILENLLG